MTHPLVDHLLATQNRDGGWGSHPGRPSSTEVTAVAIYGWPKNVLHWAGIHERIVDIDSTLPAPRFAIVDGIVGMEGNGPIQGDARKCGALVFGDDPVAVDATAARLMTIDPRKVRYLAEAGRFLGNVAEERIDQVGEPIDRLRQDFRVLPMFRTLKSFA